MTYMYSLKFSLYRVVLPLVGLIIIWSSTSYVIKELRRHTDSPSKWTRVCYVFLPQRAINNDVEWLKRVMMHLTDYEFELFVHAAAINKNGFYYIGNILGYSTDCKVMSVEFYVYIKKCLKLLPWFRKVKRNCINRPQRQ